MPQTYFDIAGMTCSACSARVHKAASAVKGVNEVTVNLLKNSMRVDFSPPATEQAIALAVKQAGYETTPRPTGSSASAAAEPGNDVFAQEMLGMKRRLAVSAGFCVPLFYISMGHMLGWPLPKTFLGGPNTLNYAFTQFLLLLPILFANRAYFTGGLRSLAARSPNMDSLIALGSGAATLYGIYAVYRIGAALGRGDMAAAHSFAMDIYFESAAVILTLITLGKYFEARAKNKTSDAVAKLMDLAPKMARVLRAGQEVSIPLEEVLPGDTLVVKTGEVVPVDGVILEGHARIDESALTGESLPVEKLSDSPVTGATILVSGHFTMRATRVGDDTTLAQIIRLVDEATSSKAPVARLADRISGIFVPIVIAIALAATTIWLLLGYGPEFALSIGIAVLVISCPCALGLATPTAIMVGTGSGAARGILFKSAEAIELLQAVDTVVLDKTGTITEGQPSLTMLVAGSGVLEATVLAVAASLERLSEHPLGKAIVQEAERRNVSMHAVTAFTQIAGQGIAGVIGAETCFAGNARLAETQGASLDPELLAHADALADGGNTVLYVGRGATLLGLIAIADRIKPSSPRAVAELAGMGIDVIMLTGDNPRTAAAVQEQAGIRHALAEVLPQDKEREIRSLQQQGKHIAMVGDGVNDAPALARADVGIAIGAGTDIAIESADVVLMKSDLLDVPAAIQLSKAVMRIIRQNLFWAFFYNSVGIPVAAGMFYFAWGLKLNPMLAAAAMGLSSVSVVTNALRLRGFRPDFTEQAAGASGIAPVSACREKQKEKTIMHKVIQIEGMNCGHCSASVERALRAVPGVADASVDLEAKQANVTLEGDMPDDALDRAISDVGFTVISIS